MSSFVWNGPRFLSSLMNWMFAHGLLPSWFTRKSRYLAQ